MSLESIIFDLRYDPFRRKIYIICFVAILVVALAIYGSVSSDDTYGNDSSIQAGALEQENLNLQGKALDEAAALIAARFEGTKYDVSVSDGIIYFTIPYVDGITKSMTVHLMNTRTHWILKQLSQCDEQIEAVFFQYTAPASDGGTLTALYARMTGKTLRSLDFATVYPTDMEYLCDDYNLHLSLE